MSSDDFSIPDLRSMVPNGNYAALALAIIHKAALDMHSRNPACASEARAWLMLIGISWCQMLGVTEAQLAAWEGNHFALPSGSHRNWRY
jgi:hypothetical protein